MNAKNKTDLKPTRKLVEAALMIAMATVLSLIKLFDLPYGGSITIASMLPILLVAYRCGTLWGLASGLAYGVIQQLLGLKNLSYFTEWYSILAIIFLDYLIAFAVIGLGGVFRGKLKSQSAEIAAGAALISLLRYLCHVISGATVWAGLSIPTTAALAYSFVYNATYMLPEAIITVLVGFYLGRLIDFRGSEPTRLRAEEKEGEKAKGMGIYGLIAGTIAVGALVYDVAAIFGHLQNAETGEFDFAGLAVESFAKSFWLPVLIVTLLACALVCLLIAVGKKAGKDVAKQAGKEE